MYVLRQCQYYISFGLFVALCNSELYNFFYFGSSLHAQQQGVSPLPRFSMLGDLQLTETCICVLQFGVGLDGKKLEPESNVLLASIENMQYAVTLDVLHMVYLITFITLRIQFDLEV